MRWPDIFFKARKKREEPAPPPPFKPASGTPLRVSAETPATSANPAPIQPESGAATNPAPVDTVMTTPRAHPLPEEIGPRPAARIAKPLVQPEPAPPDASSTDAEVARAMVEADPLRATSLSGSLRLSKRPHLDPQPHAGPVILKSEPVASVSSSVAPPPQPEAPAPAVASITNAENEGAWRETSFIVPPRDAFTATSAPTGMITVRRKAKLTDVARIVAPPPTEPEPPAPESESSSTVIPAAFTIAVPAGSVIAPTPSPAPAVEAAPPVPEIKPDPAATEKAPAPDLAPAGAETTRPTLAPTPVESVGPQAVSSEKREFLLTNGERILGRVLSETAETIYLDHGTLGVLTLPRAQIAQRPVEIILINGDRIVGDIMAETPDTLYVRHASLGMLTVPRAQRSTRVVEAILKDGDRILGEVLAETENFTVIRSATLGTVAVPHNQVTMLNRKIEQIELKALPPAAPELKDKTAE
jgi:RNase P/RNase MRP subunit p29